MPGFAEDIAEDLVDLQDSQGDGLATFLVGDQEWTFTSNTTLGEGSHSVVGRRLPRCAEDSAMRSCAHQ